MTLHCPFCAEVVADGAEACPWCGASLRFPAEGAVAPAESEPLQFSHSGRRYLLGYGRDFFGVWDRLQEGPPVRRFPRTDAGWASAWTTYVSMEPDRVEVGLPAGASASAPGPTLGPSPGPQAAHNGLAVASLVLGITGMILSIFSIPALVLGYVARGQIRRSGFTQRGDGMAIAGIVLGWIGVVLLVIAVVLIASGKVDLSDV